MLHKPKNRICPSCSSRMRANVRRQAPGEMNGIRPSKTSTRANAAQRVSLSKAYFFAAGAGVAGEALPLKTLKKSEPDGSSTITSLFLLKLAL